MNFSRCCKLGWLLWILISQDPKSHPTSQHFIKFTKIVDRILEKLTVFIKSSRCEVGVICKKFFEMSDSNDIKFWRSCKVDGVYKILKSSKNLKCYKLDDFYKSREVVDQMICKILQISKFLKCWDSDVCKMGDFYKIFEKL